MKRLLVMLILCLSVIGCNVQNEHINPQEYSKIKEQVPQLLIKEINKNDNRPEEIRVIPDSVKVHDILQMADKTYVFGIYKFYNVDTTNNAAYSFSSEPNSNNIFYALFFRVVEREGSNTYKLLGGATCEGDYDPKAPFLIGGSENIIWGINQTKFLETIKITYSDNKTIDYNVYNKKYFVLYREDDPDKKIEKVLYYDNNNHIIGQQ